MSLEGTEVETTDGLSTEDPAAIDSPSKVNDRDKGF